MNKEYEYPEAEESRLRGHGSGHGIRPVQSGHRLDKHYTGRRRRKSRAGVILSLLLLLTLIVLIFIFILYTDPRRRLIGEWQTDTDITAGASDRASAWLKAAAMGNQVELSEYMKEVRVTRTLTFGSDGSYSLSVDEQSYKESEEKAYEQMGEALEALITLRLKAAGMEAGPDTAGRLMQDRIGMSSAEYLKEFGPELIPGLDDLKARYDRSGIYTADRQIMTIDNELTAEYMVGRRMLAIDMDAAADGASAGDTSANDTYANDASADGAIVTDETEVKGPAEDEATSHPLCESMMYMRKSAPQMSMSVKSIFGSDKVHAATVKNRILENLTVHTEGGHDRSVKTIHYDYKNNRFVSLRDMAVALKGSPAEYSLSVSSSGISIDTGESYTPAGGEDELFTVRDTETVTEDDKAAEEEADSEPSEAPADDDTEEIMDEGSDDSSETDPADDESAYIYVSDKLSFNKLTVDGREVKYATITGKNPAGSSDVFMSITDVAMILDVYMWLDDDGLHVDPDKPFSVDVSGLKDAGFYTEVRSALVGDATTGEIYAGFSENVPVSVASTTKIMNLLCVMDAVSSGEISLSDRTYASLKASLLSKTGDGVIPMEPGDGFTVEELIYGMMLPSSNECSLMLAEHIAGTEDEYVKRMNDKAVEIGLSDATIFYNCHGLPIYSDNIVTSKLQNQMSASDMFSLVSYLLAVYPQVTDITSTKEYRIESAGLTVKNLNPMLYNLPEAVGIKTGTTYMAGYSLVSAVRVKDAAGTEHIVTAVEYGAEDVVTRNTVSELMLRFGIDRLSGKNEGDLSDGSLRTLPDGTNIPVTAEGLIRLLLSS